MADDARGTLPRVKARSFVITQNTFARPGSPPGHDPCGLDRRLWQRVRAWMLGNAKAFLRDLGPDKVKCSRATLHP